MMIEKSFILIVFYCAVILTSIPLWLGSAYLVWSWLASRLREDRQRLRLLAVNAVLYPVLFLASFMGYQQLVLSSLAQSEAVSGITTNAEEASAAAGAAVVGLAILVVVWQVVFWVVSIAGSIYSLTSTALIVSGVSDRRPWLPFVVGAGAVLACSIVAMLFSQSWALVIVNRDVPS